MKVWKEKKYLWTAFDLAAFTFFYIYLFHKLLNYFDSEGSFIIRTGQTLFKYGTLVTPEHHYFAATGPSTPYFFTHFLTGLFLKVFGLTTLGVTAHFKIFALLLIFSAYAVARVIWKDRLWGWCAASFLLLLPWFREFVTLRGDVIAAFFGWSAISLLLWVILKNDSPHSKKIPTIQEAKSAILNIFFMPPLRWVPCLAGACVVLSMYSHPLGFPLYMGACGLALVNFFGIRGFLKQPTTWCFTLGVAITFFIFAVFVINWEQHLYYLKRFSGLAIHYMSWGYYFEKIPHRLGWFTRTHLFMQPGDPIHITLLFLLPMVGLWWAFLKEWRNKVKTPITRYFVLLFGLFGILYMDNIPYLRQYCIHLLPLIAIYWVISLRLFGQYVSKWPKNQKGFQLIIILGLVTTLSVFSWKNLQEGKTLINSLSQNTLIQDAARDLRSVIPPGARVIANQGFEYLMPDNNVRTEYVLLQIHDSQPELPDYVHKVYERENVIYSKGAQDDQVRLAYTWYPIYHFRNFLPNYLVTPGEGYFEHMNLPEKVARFQYGGNIITVWKVNYNEWPFKDYLPGTRLYPSFSDPVSAMRYRKHLINDQANEIVIPEPALTAKASDDRDIEIDLNKLGVDVDLDGSESTSKSNSIIKYEWFLSIHNPPYQKEKWKKIGDGPKINYHFPLGRNIVHLIIEDSQGRRARDAVFINVKYSFKNFTNYALPSLGVRTSSYLTYMGKSEMIVDGLTKGGIKESWISPQNKQSWVQIDLGKKRKIDYFVLHFREDYPHGPQTHFLDILASNDPNFRQHEIAAQRREEPFPSSGFWLGKANISTPYRYYRIRKKSDEHTSIVEWKLYANKMNPNLELE